jgi:predicted O-linked N-acetylglucosamine transferase (SPINDLY family)
LNQGAKTGLNAGTYDARSYTNRAEKELVQYDLEKAKEILEEGLSQFPKDADLYRFLGEIYVQQGQNEKALLTLVEAMTLNPGNSKVLGAVGKLLMMMGRVADAKDFFRTAYFNDKTEASPAYHWMHACMDESDWSFYPELKNILRLGDDTAHNVEPFALLSVSDNPALLKMRVENRCRFIMSQCKENAKQLPKLRRDKAEGRRIRIGYFSNDLYRGHATMLLMGSFFQLHDKNRFEVFIYDYSKERDDEVLQGIQQSADHYVSVKGLSDFELAERARQDGIDIAIDLKGFTRGGRMTAFAYRCAPVQVAYLGFPGTMGMQTMDYMIGDAVTIPAAKRQDYAEKILYMPNCYQPNDRGRPRPKKITRADVGLPEDKFVFCSLNNPNKITPADFDVWMALLNEVPDSIFWLLAPNEEVKKNLTKEAVARGIDADRIFFAERGSKEDHFARFALADLFLDAFNCNAHTTASESVWAGLPILTKAGNQFAARVCSSIVSAIGCPELSVDTVEEYKALALKLATDPAALAEIRQKLQDNLMTTPLYDSEQYMRDFEGLMEMAIARHYAGDKPKHMMLKSPV